MGLSVWAIAHCVEVGEDPGWVVCDEFMAFWGCIAFLPSSQWWQAFILFRLFDIFKPWPLPWLERSLPTAYAIMFDDFVAALYALGLVYVNHWCCSACRLTSSSSALLCLPGSVACWVVPW